MSNIIWYFVMSFAILTSSGQKHTVLVPLEVVMQDETNLLASKEILIVAHEECEKELFKIYKSGEFAPNEILWGTCKSISKSEFTILNVKSRQ